MNLKIPIISLRDVSYTYSGEEQEAVQNISLDIGEGEFVAVLGHNGSGKSTLAKLLNGLLLPTHGEVSVCGLSTADEKNIWEIRCQAGMVFQNPDNQMVSSIVEEDVAFGPENLSVPPQQIRARVDDALMAVRMSEFAQSAPHMLSGGQKQRVAIAGVLAMRPKIIILDEPTAMLDPAGRLEVLETVRRLNGDGITVVWITHFMEEAVLSDRVIVMDESEIVLSGTPKEVFGRVETLRGLGLEVPPATELACALADAGFDTQRDIITEEEITERICQLLRSK